MYSILNSGAPLDSIHSVKNQLKLFALDFLGELAEIVGVDRFERELVGDRLAAAS